MPDPLAFFLTWTTYGTWLPGDPRGSTDHDRDSIRPRRIAPNDPLRSHATRIQRSDALTLKPESRAAVQQMIHALARDKGWVVHALNVRSNHVHLVITAPGDPNRVMTACKAFATQRLRQRGHFTPDQIIWTRHGSTRWINDPKSLEAAIQYARDFQDRPDRFR
tara:strand:- start:2260 stop:2751 length:492 start_codon:yes stop_codon:yes gene_type:complete